MANKPRKRRRNAFERYFIPFGLRQICDIIMVLAAIMLIIGMAIYQKTQIVLIVGLSLMILGSLIAIYRSSRVLMSGLNKRSPEYKSAVTNIIIMAIICVIAILGLVYTLI